MPLYTNIPDARKMRAMIQLDPVRPYKPMPCYNEKILDAFTALSFFNSFTIHPLMMVIGGISSSLTTIKQTFS